MSQSKRESIMLAAIAALTSVSGISNSNIFRSRVVALTRAECPALVIEPISDSADNPSIHRLQWAFVFQVSLIFRQSAPDHGADASMVSIHNKIMSDAPVLALVQDIVPSSVQWQFVESDQTLGVVSMQFTARYQTDLNTIT